MSEWRDVIEAQRLAMFEHEMNSLISTIPSFSTVLSYIEATNQHGKLCQKHRQYRF